MNISGKRPFTPLKDLTYLTPGIDFYAKLGFNQNVGNGAFEDMWTPGDQMFYFSSLQVVRISSSSASDTAAGVGARTVCLDGYDLNFNVIRATVTLNGTTPVVLPTQFLRVYRAFVVTAGTAGVNIGNITIAASVGLQVMAEIPIGLNHTLMTHYSIPAGYTGIVNEIAWTAGQAGDQAQCAFMVRKPGETFRAVWGTLMYRQHSGTSAAYFIRIPEKSDVVMRAINLNAGNVSVQGDFSIVLIPNERMAVIDNVYLAGASVVS